MAASALRRYRGRFAPSPTGPLHFGSLVAAVAAYADALACGGEFLVRIEDVDLPRAHAGAEREILATLARYGFAWDGPVVRQSERAARYAEALAQLQTLAIAYACGCTRRDLETAPRGEGGERIYPGTCRHGMPADRAARRAQAWRAAVGNSVVAFDDRLQGRQRQDLARDVGDFVVRRSDGLFAYQLAVVVDDAEAAITDVVRGADLLASTPRQIFLQRALNLPTPTYLHLPVALDAHGEKLSKQTQAPPLPRDPLPALQAAWRFLEQPAAGAPPSSVAEFWDQARRHWTPARLPPVPMLPAPREYGGATVHPGV
jgi:glutamyl-Q tRNA(Asp) synthetase